MKILIVDTPSMPTFGIAALIEQKWKEAEVHVAPTIARANQIARDKTHIVLINLQLNGSDPYALAKGIKQDTMGRTKVAFMLDSDNAENLPVARLAVAAKMNGLIIKTDPIKELYRAIEYIVAGWTYIAPAFTAALCQPEKEDPTFTCLTQRERSTLTLLAQGLAMKEVADVMDVSVKTAETHRNNLGRKLGHPNKAQMVALALRHGLVSYDQLGIVA